MHLPHAGGHILECADFNVIMLSGHLTTGQPSSSNWAQVCASPDPQEVAGRSWLVGGGGRWRLRMGGSPGWRGRRGACLIVHSAANGIRRGLAGHSKLMSPPLRCAEHLAQSHDLPLREVCSLLCTLSPLRLLSRHLLRSLDLQQQRRVAGLPARRFIRNCAGCCWCLCLCWCLLCWWYWWCCCSCGLRCD